MRVLVRVKSNSKENRVEKISDNEFSLRIKAPAKEGRANEAVLELLSEYFALPKSRILIIQGHKSRTKIINIL